MCEQHPDIEVQHTVSRLLCGVAAGESPAVDALMPLIYDELRALAGRVMKDEAQGHTLQPTALVHEAYAKLVRNVPEGIDGRRHFFAVAARAMRQVLTDHARLRHAAKRGGGAQKVTLDENATPMTDATTPDLGDLHTALEELERLNARHARVVELRYLAGLSVEEAALALGVSTRTVELDWRTARAWLRARLVTLSQGAAS